MPELDAILLTKHSDIFICEKNISVFSSVQPDGLMTKLMGQNMMRKDGQDHKAERRTIFPTVSPKTTQKVWKQKFIDHTKSILDSLSDQDLIDVVNEFAEQVARDIFNGSIQARERAETDSGVVFPSKTPDKITALSGSFL